jgi:magnesium-protoporphyrin IX monomethyl ester (oxidative) cyclase
MPGRSAPKKKLRRGFLPPLGIAYLAAVLRKEGHEVRLVDPQLEQYDITDIQREILAFAPQVVGFSLMSSGVALLSRELPALARACPDVVFIAGGAHPTVSPQGTLEKIPPLQVVFIGEAEYSLPRFITALERRESLTGLAGICFRNDSGEIVAGPPATEVVDINTLPYPARDLLPIDRYAPEPFECHTLPATTILASRGCLYARCTFCSRAGKFERHYRTRSPEAVLAEIISLQQQYGIKEFLFYDDDLMEDKRWIRSFLDLLEKERPGIFWSFRGRPNSADPDILRRARANGCVSIAYGFESGYQELLDRIKKGTTIAEARQAARWTREAGLDVVGTFMLAMPGETPAMGEKTIDFAIELDCSFASFTPTHPMEGTPLYEDALKAGQIYGDPYGDKIAAIRFIPRVSYIPEGYPNAKAVRRVWLRAYRRFYLRPAYWWKIIAGVRTKNDLARLASGIGMFLNILRGI